MGEAIEQARMLLIVSGTAEGEQMAAAIGDSRSGLKDEGVRAMLEKLPGLCRDDYSRETIVEALRRALTSNPKLSLASRVRIEDTIRNLQSLHSSELESRASLQEAQLRPASSSEKKTMLASQTLSAVGQHFRVSSQAYAISGKAQKTLESAERLLAHEQTVAQLQSTKHARLSLSGKIERHSAPRIFFGTKPGKTGQTAMKNFITDTVQQAIAIGTPEALAKAHTILDTLKGTEQCKQMPKEAKMGEAIEQARMLLIVSGTAEGEQMAAAIGDSSSGLKDEGIRAMLEKLPGLCRDDYSRKTIVEALQRALTSNPKLSPASRVRIEDTIKKLQA